MGPTTYATSFPSGEIAGWNSGPGSFVMRVMFEVVIWRGSRPSQRFESVSATTTTTAAANTMGKPIRQSRRDAGRRAAGTSPVCVTSACAVGVVVNRPLEHRQTLILKGDGCLELLDRLLKLFESLLHDPLLRQSLLISYRS